MLRRKTPARMMGTMKTRIGRSAASEYLRRPDPELNFLSRWQQASDHGRAAGCPDWGKAS